MSTTKRASRRMTSVKAKLRRGTGFPDMWEDVTIANISDSGIMAKASVPPPVGQEVEVRHRGYGFSGEVVWVAGRRFGIRSAEEIDLSQLLSPSELAARRAEDNQPTARFWHWMRKR